MAAKVMNEYTAKAKEVILLENSTGGDLLVPNISGIVSLGHTTDVTEVTAKGGKYTVAHDHNVNVGRWATKVVVANVAAHDVGLHAETIDNGGDSLENGILQRGDYLFHRELFK